MAPMPLTGSIGATLTVNAELQAASNRKALPDQVTSFSLPTIERPEKVAERKRQLALQKKNTRKQKSGRLSSSRQKRDDTVDDIESEQEEEEEADVLDIENSMILIQSLRQSRLAILTSMLPYLSTRHRTSTKYHPPPKDHPFPGGLDPSMVPPTLLNLGKADIRIGPFVFPRTRFSEARVEGGIQDVEGASLLKGPTDPSTPIKISPKKRQRKPKTLKPREDGSILANTSIDDQANASLVSTNATPTPVKPLASGMSTPSTSAIPMQSTPNSKPNPSHDASPSSEVPIRTPPVPAPGTPPINEKVVKAVSAAAQNDPALQTLLYVAANNKATPDQLRELAAFIAKVSAGLEKLEREQLEQRKKEEEEQAKLAAKKAARAAEAKARRAAKKAAALEEAAKKAAENPEDEEDKETKEISQEKDIEDDGMEISTTRFIPAPSANKLPPYPPIVVVEFRENPSARFILPLWRDAIVERRKDGDEHSIKVSFLLPAIGSSAALRASNETSAPTTNPTKNKSSKNAKQTVAPSVQAEGTDPKQSYSPTNPPTEEDLKKAAPQGAETRLMTWTINGTDESPLSDALWQIFGRVTGAKTFVDGIEVEQGIALDDEKPVEMMNTTQEGTNNSKVLPYDVLAALIAKLRALPTDNQDDDCMPKFRVRPDEIPRDLPDHLSDKFAPRVQVLSSRPIYRLKRSAQAEEDDPQYEVLRNIHGNLANAMLMKRAQIKGALDDDEGADTSMGLDGGGDETTYSFNGTIFGDGPPKPKRKRHVAKFNEDGTLKLCQACGTNSTPMWRRGPAGKSTLCNACGAKWKVGRLVVPDHPPTIPLKEEKSTSNEVKKSLEPDTTEKEKEGGTTEPDVLMQDKVESTSNEVKSASKVRERRSPRKEPEMIVLV